ncbi:bifunctional 2-C-methyl-D-erythritol 4-phosphate cytidylyltransferase/2-C-methyl-D-erythritol 2,4-cyclodiphosphate synthase [Roseovarius sp. LXJ103]|uniref:bifunctional 2-C-methyl-D-erythritol 4-phosphate cytidylyltransferase/2-C-methyl-D-erythritol 2,4-cyclodiphosphate synthase n=1 Tax=Roseovarius carneus TaxID=2853164 RepID=UPI000D60E752|nr:bifunctional 2-C-methyl-D-erythritol 4-phosphate cytidylyltransferase/2-C-methyl-D-erythritol 2,4-cyclodiphosphate synthase [Roseovarius carneus]MBZ8119397.1 bifunctional 2-C-methyl-D-erythritol 4-phosphate cytidylyltransferase/2-C-methyl-D-erythritol 2,4-cyclodiphosphate synthase [Roseovarius carneus]PWE34957.1 bifunctional 2-C-methyl-D-erythritol 4-phosphate cytidylyltransferase/2-C-methyl-D-erythritol 2,4-cyclodiphosphate synthase [Pelagicola sp. LXJ1103]
MTCAAIIVAAGRGSRAGGPLPKQWQPLGGARVIDWTLKAFAAMQDIAPLVVVLHPDDIAGFNAPNGVETAPGGATRAASVLSGLRHLEGRGITTVLIHDVARPCVTSTTIRAVQNALKTAPAAAPALPVTDALWTGAEGRVTGTQDRSGLFRAQTPQGFHFDLILAAHLAHTGGAADDVEVARAAGLDVAIVPGDEGNLKITHQPDFARAKAQLRGAMDIRIGNGYDVHRFGPGDHVMLCGVAVPHGRALQGHSDADVGLHALTDAIYGALAEGDIGRHFPPSDPQWKGAPSDIFLRHAVELSATKGFQISNLDLTLVCEHPKIGPHAPAMIARVADICAVEPSRVSVKATTSERLGFTGREEGIAAIATAALVAP